MPTCPNGHQSASDDWCEVCGHRMAAPAGTPGPPSYGYPPTGGEPTAQAELCPQCRTPREAMAPFCEECRYNFLTRTATPYVPPAAESGPGAGTVPPPPPAPPQPVFSQDHFEYQGSRPSRVNRPAEPLQGEDDWLLQPPAQEQPAASRQPVQPQLAAHQRQDYPQEEYRQEEYRQQPPPSQPEYQQPFPPQNGGVSWTATIGPDRSYFMAMMQRSGPEAAGLNLPAYSPEQHLPLSGGQITIGRRRASTGESPDIDLSVPPEDPGVSHQHAVLVQQPDLSWAVVDQNSTNGTTINGGAEPIQPYVPVPLTDGDRVHVGAWTTITVRRG
ncbi:FHA domain-containing protein [Streptomyces sp. NBC_00091]|uniref:FHA domain-containing protein n=1 Tax=Streptomyces sp. NBC_00091 TaxID=2975648 RepID=UPI002254AD56|nr:FHA domain-containing protein [Streptomyces sp. NBC_00091]MCX5378304.1 FHA domain-containing protein [Streptomyces sp. NBC_00091]